MHIVAKETITELRKQMKAHNIDAYMIVTDDFHGSEYVGDHFKCRAYMSGFTGSAGTLVVTQDMAMTLYETRTTFSDISVEQYVRF